MVASIIQISDWARKCKSAAELGTRSATVVEDSICPNREYNNLAHGSFYWTSNGLRLYGCNTIWGDVAKWFKDLGFRVVIDAVIRGDKTAVATLTLEW